MSRAESSTRRRSPLLQLSAVAAAIIGVLALVLSLGPAVGLVAVVLIAAEFALLAWLCMRQIGGQTGDVVGALEQIGEMTILLVAAATVAA